MINRSTRRIAPRVLACMLAGAPAFAQTTAQPETQGAGPGKSATAASADAAVAVPVRAHPVVERRIADLHSRLKITAAEQPAFDAFADVMRTNAQRMDALLHARRTDLANASAVDQMRSYQALADAHVQDMQRLVPAFEHLYDALSPAQKRQADSSFRDFAKSGRA